jgi:type I restriction enzyme M protein
MNHTTYMNDSSSVSFLWNIAKLIRDNFRRSKYLDVILPFSLLFRIDCVLADDMGKALVANGRY